MQAKYMTDEHIMFRDSVREFIKRDIAPYHEQWEKDEIVPRDIWLKAGENGFLCMDVPEEYGGMGIDDYRYLAIFAEEFAAARLPEPGFGITNELVVPNLLAFATTAEQDG